MGGLLSTKEKSPIAWEDAVRAIGGWEDVRERDLAKVLALSYRDLPPELKLCFLYLCRFPEDSDIELRRLILLLVAEGLVPDQQVVTMEEIAEGWMEDLVRRCMVQATQREASGMLQICRLHDALRDLSIKEAKKMNFFSNTWQQQQQTVPATTRRLVVMEGYDINQLLTLGKLRTLFYVDLHEQGLKNESLRSFRLLRVLQLEKSKCRMLPEAIGDLIHLRYLGLRSCRSLESIPSSVGSLQNLQTLDVDETHRSLRNLPEGLWGIGTLRHVFLDGQVPHISHNNQRLVHLQTLSFAGAGGWVDSSLTTFTSLRTLSIVGKTHNAALPDYLNNLVHLRFLYLEGDSLPRGVLALRNHRRLQTLELFGRLEVVTVPAADNPVVPAFYTSEEMPPNVTTLRLTGSGLQQDPFVLLHKMPYLKVLLLSINAFDGEEALCSTGGFPQLEELELFGLLNLRRWTVEEGALPRLRSLDVAYCRKLEMLPDGLQHIKTLQVLKISDMSKEFMRRLRRSDEGGGGEDCHKIQHVPQIIID